MNVLLIEDNETITKGLEYFLKENGYQVLVSNNLKEASKYVKEAEFIILDVVLPDGNGFDFYQTIPHIPTIFLTAKEEEENIIKGLQLGAEDYMTKPFSSKELLVRMEKIVGKKNQIQVKDITLDRNKMQILKSGKAIELTTLELKITTLLFQNIGKVVSRDILLDSIWEWTGNDVDDHTITVYMKRIREKLGTEVIKTVKGIGYLIDESV